MRRQPSDDVRPDTRVSLPSYKNSEVLQCNADLAGVFDERDILGRQRIKERFNRGKRCNLVCRVDDRECREVETAPSACPCARRMRSRVANWACRNDSTTPRACELTHTFVSWFARKNFENKKKSPLVQFAQCLVSGMEPTLCSEAQMSQFDPEAFSCFWLNTSPVAKRSSVGDHPDR